MSLLKKMPLSKASYDPIKAQTEDIRTVLKVLEADDAVANAKKFIFNRQVLAAYDSWRYSGWEKGR